MIKNKVALVTGVSSGIGQETAQILAERGARVFGRWMGSAKSQVLATPAHLDSGNGSIDHDALATLARL